MFTFSAYAIDESLNIGVVNAFLNRLGSKVAKKMDNDRGIPVDFSGYETYLQEFEEKFECYVPLKDGSTLFVEYEFRDGRTHTILCSVAGRIRRYRYRIVSVRNVLVWMKRIADLIAAEIYAL